MFNFNKPVATVDTVLTAFRTTISELQAVATAQTDFAVAQARIAAEALTAQNSAQAEATRATAIAAQMEAIFG